MSKANLEHASLLWDYSSQPWTGPISYYFAPSLPEYVDGRQLNKYFTKDINGIYQPYTYSIGDFSGLNPFEVPFLQEKFQQISEIELR